MRPITSYEVNFIIINIIQKQIISYQGIIKCFFFINLLKKYRMDNLKDEVTEILKKYTIKKDVWDDFNENIKIIADLKINSARIVDIIIDLEEKYDIEIDDSELVKLTTFKSIVDIVKQKTL